MIGSANLADRSMGTDTECNLALEACGDPHVERTITGFRDRLLVEHLDRSPSDVAEATRGAYSLHHGIAALRREGRRCLVVIEPELDPNLDAMVPDQQVLDPERPIDPDTVVADLVPREAARTGVRGRLIGVALAVVALTAACARMALHVAAGVARSRPTDRARHGAARGSAGAAVRRPGLRGRRIGAFPGDGAGGR